MKRLRVGLVGASTVSTYAIIAPAREMEGVEVVAVAARDPERARAYAERHGIPRALPDYDALFADPDIDLVYIGTPPRLHAKQAIAAITAGKAVLVEKPFALSSADAARVAMIAREAGVPIFEAMHSPHHRLFTHILEIANCGVLGPWRSIEAVFDAPIDADDPIRWRADLGGGALMDLGVYPLAWVRRIAGEQFTVAAASAVMRAGVDEAFEAHLDFGSGLTARVASSMIAQSPFSRLRIAGGDGVLTVDNPLAPQRGHKLTAQTVSKTWTETVEGPSSYVAQLTAVRAAVLDHADFPFPPEDFVRSMEAIERIQVAIAEGG